MKIFTNNKPRKFLQYFELPKKYQKIAKLDFEYLGDVESEEFFIYKGTLYHLSDFMAINYNPNTEFSKWRAYLSDTYFSGIVIKISSDGEEVICGTYYC